jgi:uncharacterized protein YjbJ (UPF0337 family)
MKSPFGKTCPCPIVETLPDWDLVLQNRAFKPTKLQQEINGMNEDRIKGNWKQFKGKIKQQWGKLTDDEIDTMEGKKDVMVGKIQEKYGLSKDEASRQYDDFVKSNPDLAE